MKVYTRTASQLYLGNRLFFQPPRTRGSMEAVNIVYTHKYDC